MLSDVQKFYPERLGCCGVGKMGWVGRVVMGLVWPFVDDYTKSKVSHEEFSQQSRIILRLVCLVQNPLPTHHNHH